MNVLPLILAAVISQAEPTVGLQTVATGLSSIVSVTHAGDNRIFITQQGGRVMIYDGTRVLPEPFLDISGLVTSDNERGLLSIAFHPEYAFNGFFYVNYTNLQGNTIVARYSVQPQNPNRANPNSALPILGIAQPFSNQIGRASCRERV